MTPQQGEIRSEIERVLMRIAPEADMTTLDPDEPIRDQLDIDSFDFLQFIIGLHKSLGVDVPESDYPHLSTLAGAIDYVSARMPGTPDAVQEGAQGGTS